MICAGSMIQTPINSFNVANVMRNLSHGCGYSDRVANPAEIISRESEMSFRCPLNIVVEPDLRSSKGVGAGMVGYLEAFTDLRSIQSE